MRQSAGLPAGVRLTRCLWEIVPGSHTTLVCVHINNRFNSKESHMKTRILNRNTILAVLFASVVVVLFSSGLLAQGTAAIKALLP
jgi:hypothetical protein